MMYFDLHHETYKDITGTPLGSQQHCPSSSGGPHLHILALLSTEARHGQPSASGHLLRRYFSFPILHPGVEDHFRHDVARGAVRQKQESCAQRQGVRRNSKHAASELVGESASTHWTRLDKLRWGAQFFCAVSDHPCFFFAFQVARLFSAVSDPWNEISNFSTSRNER